MVQELEGAVYGTPEQLKHVPLLKMEINTVTKLVLIAKKAKEERKAQFSRLMYLLHEDYLYECFKLLKRGKAAGVDGRKMESYSDEEIRQAIVDTVTNLKMRKFKPQPVRRVYIEKGNGKMRPLGIPTVMDKVVQLACARILTAIYEQDFLPVSYGYRVGKDAHECLKEINHMIMRQKVNYILDCDIEGFFDNLDHKWLMRCLSERISDTPFKRVVWKFLKAGILEEGKFFPTKEGSPQGGIISPVLANIYLHFVLDLYFEGKIKPTLKGYSKLVRYADDFLIGIQYQEEAANIQTELTHRLQRFGLTLSKEKTAIKEFGRFASENRERRGQGKPETFNFLGFTHYCSKTQDGRFQVRVKTQGKRLNKAVVAMNTYLKKTRSSLPVQEIWKTVSSKLKGHYNYYGVSGNFKPMQTYYLRTRNQLFRWLNKRSEKKSFNWERFQKYLEIYPLPEPKLTYALYNPMHYTILGKCFISESRMQEICLSGSIGGFNMCYPLKGGSI